MSARETKSPISNLPVHMPGQSLRAKRDALFDDKMAPYLIVAALLLFLTVMEWYACWQRLPRMPWLYTAMALVAIVVACVKFRSAVREGKDLRLGLLGEEAVGQFLDEKMRPLDCQVLHDIPGENFNIDHVVIGPTGIFAIETKTHSKPAKGACNVVYDGAKVTVNGYSPNRDPIVQARAQASWLSSTIQESTGRRLFVKPIVVYPGWYVTSHPETDDVWVLNANPVPTFIMNNRRSMSPEDVSLVTFHLKRYVISQDKAKQG